MLPHPDISSWHISAKDFSLNLDHIKLKEIMLFFFNRARISLTEFSLRIPCI